MLATDEAALLDFFLRVPDADRFYLKEDVTSPEVIGRWFEHLDYGRVLPHSHSLDTRRIVSRERRVQVGSL